MTYAFRASLYFATAAERDDAAADIQQQIAGRPRWGDTTLDSMDHHGNPLLAVFMRFTSQQDAEQILDAAERLARRLGATSGELMIFSCTIDEGVDVDVLLDSRVI